MPVEEQRTAASMRDRLRALLPRTNTLFVQIVARLIVVVAGFALLDLAIVLTQYSSDENSLSQDVIDLQVTDIASSVLGEIAVATDADALLSSRLSKGQFERSARIFDEHGRELARYNADGIHLPVAPVSTTLVNWNMREAIANGVRITGVKGVEVSNHKYWVAVAVEGDPRSIYAPALIREVMQHVALPLIPLMVLLLVFSILAVRAALLPLQRTVDDVEHLGPLDVSRRLAVPNNPVEVGALALALNKALDRMERAISQLRDFTADVAHELRTPLMVMTLTIDRLPDVPERATLKKDARDMSQLVTQLLDFAHADSLVVANTMSADLRSIAVDVVAQLTPVALDAGKEFHFNDYGTAVINGHPDAISRAMRNIIENALKHAPSGTVIDVSSGPGAVLSVRDRGPGFPDREPQKLLERFQRGRSPSGAGLGLGLNIVQRVMRAHDGTVDLHNAPDGGAVVVLTFNASRR